MSSTPLVPVLDPVQVEVIGSALASVAEEMGEMLVKASYSPNIKERRDCTTCIFDARGETLAQAEHIPLHLGSLMGITGAITDRYAPEDIRDGDTFVGNDPHTGGGTHLPDIVLATPVFVDGTLVAWVTNLAHHADFVDRTHAHIFQEGIRIPAVRFARDWEIRTRHPRDHPAQLPGAARARRGLPGAAGGQPARRPPGAGAVLALRRRHHRRGGRGADGLHGAHDPCRDRGDPGRHLPLLSTCSTATSTPARSSSG